MEFHGGKREDIFKISVLFIEHLSPHLQLCSVEQSSAAVCIATDIDQLSHTGWPDLARPVCVASRSETISKLKSRLPSAHCLGKQPDSSHHNCKVMSRIASLFKHVQLSLTGNTAVHRPITKLAHALPHSLQSTLGKILSEGVMHMCHRKAAG